MNKHECLIEMNLIRQKMLNYIDSNENSDEMYDELITFLNDIKIRNNESELIEFFHIILHLANYHHRTKDLYDKIDRILLLFKDEIRSIFTNYAIFKFFQSNNRILLFLMKENLFTIDESIANTILKSLAKEKKSILDSINLDKIHVTEENKFLFYFYPELKPFMKLDFSEFEKKYVDDTFDQKRQIGENDKEICRIIRNDSIREFVRYVTLIDYDLDSEINESIFETNSFLISMTIQLIEYAAFFGSLKIFKYLLTKGAELTDGIMIYAVHGRNAEIIRLIEENCQIEDLDYYLAIHYESLTCHHDEIENYFYKNSDFDPLVENQMLSCSGLYFYNYLENLEEKLNTLELCQCDLPFLITACIEEEGIDINGKYQVEDDYILKTKIF